jgi:hypothetical protein
MTISEKVSQRHGVDIRKLHDTMALLISFTVPVESALIDQNGHGFEGAVKSLAQGSYLLRHL